MKKTTHSDKYRDMYKIKWDEESFLNLLSERINKNFNNTNNDPNHQTFNLVFPQIKNKNSYEYIKTKIKRSKRTSF